MEHSGIRYELSNHIGTITLDRPGKLNTVTRAMGIRLNELCQEINQDQNVRVVVLTGEGEKSFSAGSDIEVLDDYGSPWELSNREDYCMAVRSIRKPVIAMIRGYAIGGGLELALHADIRYASLSARFGAGEIKLGWIGGSGSTQLLPRIVGPGKAAEMVLTGRLLSAAEALSYGLVEQVAEQGELQKLVYETAEAIAAHSPIAVQHAKLALRAAMNMPLDAGLQYENSLFSFCFTTEDAQEGKAAFQEKRAPKFKGC
ncbi:enoyl-CoA hydratase/isomerase family protein [Paenibacillus sp. F411]|uniref:Enoyl-CoA hydratase/isomerase n=1 Tax=Paenibacillus algicola TaxID=2565926 RepID=A0A4P8XM22_9BACL|nr:MULTISPECIES: enoyl-CoA hydratase/isomerase family protein [Paenibacillus]MBO2943551.1 enoyl-CoA hydratase/isomerase family protein [Paenibacillus sp. F411]QCT03847.1 enoyl-CoA hydratase/isomerase [Paenibacillus algicola]